MTETTPEVRPPRATRPLSPAEWTVAGVAVLIIVGWIIAWIDDGFSLRGWFAPLSFFGAVGVVAFFAAEILGFGAKLPEGLQGRVLPILCLVPLFGFLLSTLIVGWSRFLTVGGSITLAALAARLFWRDYVVRALDAGPAAFGGRARETRESPKAGPTVTPPTSPPSPEPGIEPPTAEHP